MEDRLDLKDILAEVSPEEILCELAVDYRLTTGSSGQQLNIHECPRCGGSAWKVYLNADTGLGNCFHGSCADEGGFNLFTFTRATLAEDNAGAVKFFTDYVSSMGWRPKPEAAPPPPKQVFKLPDYIPLPHDGKQLSYLLARGFSKEITAKFGWGYCEKGHFVVNPGTEREYKQNYAGRVLIPIANLDGELVTFQGRDVTGMHEPKYLFPPGLQATGSILYGAHLVKGTKEIAVGEGVFDAASLYRIMPAVATFGKHLGTGSADCKDQLGVFTELQRHGLETINLCWDGERSALLDTIKPAMQLKSLGFMVRIVVLPHNKDPNECTQGELERAFAKSIKVSQMGLAKFKLRLLSGDFLPQMKDSHE